MTAKPSHSGEAGTSASTPAPAPGPTPAPAATEAERARRRRSRSIAIGLLLGALVILFYVITVLKLAGSSSGVPQL